MCLACGPDNPIGLRIVFSVDDVMGSIPCARGVVAHAARGEIRYRSQLREGQTVALRGWIEKEKGRLMAVRGEARRKSNKELIAECTARFLVEN